jgi:translocation and assembly module TamB
MASGPPPDTEGTQAPVPVPVPVPVRAKPKRRWSRMSLAFIALLVLLCIAAAGALRWIDTQSGHRFLISRVETLRPASGLRISVGSIEGSVFRKMRLRDLRFSDDEGRFASVSQADLQWYPLAWFMNRIDIDRLHVTTAELSRLPRLKSTGPRKSILPDFDIRVMDFRVDRLALGAAVSGQPHVVAGRGGVDIRAGRAVAELRAKALDGADSIQLSLDSRPDQDRFDLDAVVAAPAGGIIAGLAGLDEAAALAIKGNGSWTRWRGRLVALRRSGVLVNVDIEARKGAYNVRGPVALIGPLSVLGKGSAMLDAAVTFERRVLAGKVGLSHGGIVTSATGGLDLGRARFDNLLLEAQAADLSRVNASLAGRGALLKARLSGPFDKAALDFLFTLGELRQGDLRLSAVKLTGEGKLGSGTGAWPVSLTVGALRTGTATLDSRLRNLNAQGLIRLVDGDLLLDGLRLRASGFAGQLKGRLSPGSGALDLALTAGMDGLEIDGLGRLDADAVVRLARAPRGTLGLSGTARAAMLRLDNGFLRGIGGGLPVVTSDIGFGAGGRLELRNTRLVAPSLTLEGSGYRAPTGLFHITGRGTHESYGPLDLTLDGRIDRPRVELMLHRPTLGMGLADVRLLLDPTEAGFTLDSSGRSALGPFTAKGAILLPQGGNAQIAFDAIQISDVVAQGVLAPVDGGVVGRLMLTGPADGSIAFSVADGVQKLALDADLGGANFAGPPRLTINRGSVQATAVLKDGAVSLDGQVDARGVRYGSLRVGRLAATAKLVNGEGTVNVSTSAQNGQAFSLNARADVTPDRVAINLSGTVQREPVRLAGPAVLRREADGWRLLTTRLNMRNGAMQIGAFVGPQSTHVDAQLSRLPLSLLDLADDELGLGGTADGSLLYDQARGGVPTGTMNLRIKGLTRSGLALSSAPIDIGINAALDNRRGAMRAVISEGGTVIGRAQALLTPLGAGSLMERLNAAPLQAQINYAGSSDTLWRLTNIELLSFGGRVGIAAQARGTLADPQISGTVSTQDASLQSPVTGMALSKVSAKGTFDGDELRFSNLAGQTAGGGKVNGTAVFTFSGERGIGMDIALNTERAVVLDRDDVGATVTGPLRIRSTGGAGTISGNLDVVASRFMLGRAATVAEIPLIRLIEINRQGDEVASTRSTEPWRLDIKAKAANGLQVEGLGMTSEWAADLEIIGTVTSPAFRGTATLIGGSYDFAGRRFDLREGRLIFNGGTPVNPELDIRAVADVSDLNATISVTGTSLRPIVAMTSIPAMPQDELLARLLFGTSITQLSAPEAIQLASAVAAFQGGGGGLDPINAIRRATGLSRLRILPADAITGQKTSIAAGKNIGRLYVELITDGQGYSATRVEFQITRWLSLLSSVSTIGRQNIGARVSKDY